MVPQRGGRFDYERKGTVASLLKTLKDRLDRAEVFETLIPSCFKKTAN